LQSTRSSRREYQDHLLRISSTGDFEPWIQFFSEAVRAQSVRAVEKIDALHNWRDQALSTMQAAGIGGVATRIAEELIGYPLITATLAGKRYGVSYQAANTAITRLVRWDSSRSGPAGDTVGSSPLGWF
jgi:Fic family protein